MKSLWNEKDALEAIATYGRGGVGDDLALAVYSTRLIGADPKLVLHGGGNSSVKTAVTDVTGETIDVLCIKGSGWDMGTIEPPGLPAVRLQPLQALLRLPALSDEDMVNIQRRNLLDSTAPNPSVECLLHAFLPHKFIQHTHANAVLALSDQPRGDKLCREVYGDRVALVPYVMPGFDLSKKVKETFDAHPDCHGIILLKHGVLSFGETARDAYERMIEIVDRAEKHLVQAKSRARKPAPAITRENLASPAAIAPILRGLLAEATGDGEYRRMILTFRTSDTIRDYVNGEELNRYACAGTVTPDHVIRTKPWPAILPAPRADGLAEFTIRAREVIAAYVANYRTYFERENQRVLRGENAQQGTTAGKTDGKTGGKTMLDPCPRVLLVPGLGLFAAGPSLGAAEIAADLTETTIDVVTAAESIDTFESIPTSDLFDMEYWSLEQAKLGKQKERALARQVVVVTGGASGIGAATAAAFKAEGAEVVILDRVGPGLDTAGARLGVMSIPCDVTDRTAITSAFDRVCERLGGVDIVVSNAGAAWQGAIGDVDEETLRTSFELNFWAHQRIAQGALAIMRKQSTGGVLLFNASKQAMNPGPKLGPYGLPKSATLQLARQYALDHGAEGIRANVVNADRIRTGLLTDHMITSRAAARGVSEHDYMSGNLLGREVTADDVARAFVQLALLRSTTAAVITVDGGNIAAAVR